MKRSPVINKQRPVFASSWPQALRIQCSLSLPWLRDCAWTTLELTAQFEALDLTVCRLGQILDEHDIARILVRREPFLHKPLQFIGQHVGRGDTLPHPHTCALLVHPTPHPP